ncbi:hypothetical protein HNR25_001968 [Streptomonospora salina]|uniref:Uncharacterized protein n=1 Tax=Streptomonospora salina TaxID=104205 RepID=A0A841E329_9ACTN|nr:hypothetical protein [Streptomonospora salina]
MPLPYHSTAASRRGGPGGPHSGHPVAAARAHRPEAAAATANLDDE